MNLGLQAIQLVIAQVRAEELKDEEWLAEIKKKRERLVDYIKWRRESESVSSEEVKT